MPRILLLLFATLAAASPQCLPVTGERILAGDMARAVPAFAGLAPDLVLGSAPAPGARRTYEAAELARLARRYGLSPEPGQEACFVRPVETLTRERVAAALRAAMPAASIEVLEFSRQPIPPGELRFPLSRLRADPANSILMWSGAVIAPGRDDFPVWAKVRIQVSGKRAISTEVLAPGHPIELSQLREETYEGAPGLPDLSQVIGCVPRRPIPAGTVIERQWLDPPIDVMRGELVRVEMRVGQARVLLDAEALSSGRRGETIAVRNAGNGKTLRAMVTDRRRLVLAGSEAPYAAGGSR